MNMKKENNCLMYIVRHGETDWNVGQRMQGHSDIALNERGHNQAEVRAKSLQHIDFDAVYASDLKRAKKTAEIIVGTRDLKIVTSPLLRERFFGALEGKYFREIDLELKYVFENYKNNHEKIQLEKRINIESVNSVERVDYLIPRFTMFLREVAQKHRSQTVLIVCHGGIMSHFLETLGFISSPKIENTGYMQLLCDGSDFEVIATEGISQWQGLW